MKQSNDEKGGGLGFQSPRAPPSLTCAKVSVVITVLVLTMPNLRACRGFSASRASGAPFGMQVPTIHARPGDMLIALISALAILMVGRTTKSARPGP